MAWIDEVAEATTWLRATLLADAALTAVVGQGVYLHPAPRQAVYPFVTYQVQTTKPDLLVVGTRILWAEIEFLLRATNQGTDALALAPAVAAVTDALHGKTGTTANARIVSCVRHRPFSVEEVTDSVQYVHRGGFFRVQVQPLNF